jgi:hypothetical protein
MQVQVLRGGALRQAQYDLRDDDEAISRVRRRFLYHGAIGLTSRNNIRYEEWQHLAVFFVGMAVSGLYDGVKSKPKRRL